MITEPSAFDKKHEERSETKAIRERPEHELLCDFFMFFRVNGERLIGHSVEELVDIYLENKEKKK